MTLKLSLKKLEKKKIISKSPNPIFPFLLALANFILYYITLPLTSSQIILLNSFLLYLAIFTLIFAILHLIIYKILKS